LLHTVWAFACFAHKQATSARLKVIIVNGRIALLFMRMSPFQ
jgi:hypothetical protein